MTIVLSEETKARMRVSYVARRVPLSALHMQLGVPADPASGDIVLARVEKIGKNTTIELVEGRRCTLHQGDLVVVAFGNRYATLQFEGYARSAGDRCDLLSMGGLCGLVESKHDNVSDPSKLRILGAIGDADGRPLRLSHYSLSPALSPLQAAPRVIGVCGTSMDAGKTYTVRSVVLGLRRQGLRVAAIKLTGTASGNDTFSMLDAGATPALDFIDAGHPSTYLCSLKDLLHIYGVLVSQATAQRADCIVIEIADGLVQRETTALLTSPPFAGSVNAWLLAANDAPGAAGAVSILKSWGITPVAITGNASRSALVRQEVEAATGIACLPATDVETGALNPQLLTARRRLTGEVKLVVG
ncbi:MAG: DUF1611 domain-containing protein [Gemmatimonadaceae bacterium]